VTVLLLRLAVRLAYSRHRTQRWRQISVCCGAWALTFTVLLSLAVVGASTAAATRRAARMPVLALAGEPAGLMVSLRGEIWRKRQFPVLWVAPGGRGRSVLPPGLRALPPPGTAVLSPGLIAAGFQTTGLGFRPAATGTGVGGSIGADGLASASEWLVYARPPAGRTLGSGGVLFLVKGYGPRSGEPTMSFETEAPTPSSSAAGFGVAWLFVLPAFLLGASCAVALSVLRGRRAQTLFRLGLSRSALAVLGAVETSALAAPGVVVGAVLWVAAAPSLAAIPGTGIRLVPAALVLPVPTVLVVAVGALVLMSVLGATAVRPAFQDRKVKRVTGPASVRAWRAAPLAAAGALMVIARLVGGVTGVRVLMLGLIATLASLPLAMPWLVFRLGGYLGRLNQPHRWLAGRRMSYSSVALARPAAAVGALIFVAGAVTGIQARLASAESTYDGGAPVNNFLLGWRDSRPSDVVWLRRQLPQAAIAVVIDGPNSTSQAVFTGCQDVAKALPVPAACPNSGLPSLTQEAKFEHVFNMPATINPRLQPTRGDVADVLIAGGPPVTAEKIWRLTNDRLSAVNLSRVGPEPLAAPLATSWIRGAGAIGVLLLLLTVLHAFGNRTLSLVTEDRQLLRIALVSREVRAVQRATLIGPLAVSIVVGTAAALLFIWAGDPVMLALPATRLVLLEAVAVAAITSLATLCVGALQRSWLDGSTSDGLR